MVSADLKILLALEANWIVSLDGREFLPLAASEILLDGPTIRFGRYSRKILDIEWLRTNIVRLRVRAKFKARVETLIFYPGDRLPPVAGLKQRRRGFQTEIARALLSYFGAMKIERQTLYSDRSHAIGGAYPRFLVGKNAVIAVDSEESPAVINGLMRAALLWAPLVRRKVTVIVPRGRHQTISSRLRVMHRARTAMNWLAWDGQQIAPLEDDAVEPETHVYPFDVPESQTDVARICSLAPALLQAVPHIAGKSVSIRLRGIEVARVSEAGTTYPFGEPIERTIEDLAEARQYGSRHPLARAYEERWLESNLIGEIRRLLPSIDSRFVYPQVPSFAGEDRNIIDMLTVTENGRLVVIEIKASPDPDLPFQALDYWIAVERHRKAGDFTRKGYFPGIHVRNDPAMLVLVAPLLAFHKTTSRLIAALPAEVPLLEIGINQAWKKEIKILRRKGMVS